MESTEFASDELSEKDSSSQDDSNSSDSKFFPSVTYFILRISSGSEHI